MIGLNIGGVTLAIVGVSVGLAALSGITTAPGVVVPAAATRSTATTTPPAPSATADASATTTNPSTPSITSSSTTVSHRATGGLDPAHLVAQRFADCLHTLGAAAPTMNADGNVTAVAFEGTVLTWSVTETSTGDLLTIPANDQTAGALYLAGC